MKPSEKIIMNNMILTPYKEGWVVGMVVRQESSIVKLGLTSFSKTKLINFVPNLQYMGTIFLFFPDNLTECNDTWKGYQNQVFYWDGYSPFLRYKNKFKDLTKQTLQIPIVQEMIKTKDFYALWDFLEEFHGRNSSNFAG